MRYIKEFTNHNGYDDYINSEDKILPNVSLCNLQREVHYNPHDSLRYINCIYDVTDTTSAVKLRFNYGLLPGSFTTVEKLEIDGVFYDPKTKSYTFDTTGEHYAKFYIKDGVGTISTYFFMNCTNLIKVKLSSGFTSIEERTFAGCPNLTKIEIPYTLTSIGKGAFVGCYKLTDIIIPNSVTTIGGGAFGGCNFDYIVFETLNPNATFVRDTTNKIITNTDGDVLISGFNNTLSIPNTITSIDEHAFRNCRGLTSITIPNSVTTIGQYAFDSCSGITDLTIGNSVTSIGNSAFNSCSSITTITSLATTAPTIQSKTFESVNPNGTLYVPSGSTGYDVWMGTGDSYLGKYNWTKVDNIPY